MSAIKSTLKVFTGKGDFESIYDDLHKVYTSLLFGSSKYQLKSELAKIVPSLRKASERQSEKNKKKLSYLNHIFKALVAWDAQSYGTIFDIEAELNTMNSTNKGETIDKARSLLRRIIGEMNVLFEAEHRVMNLSMRKLQGLGTKDQEAEKNEIYRVAGVARGTPLNSSSQRRITTVLARKKLGLSLNGRNNAGIEDVVGTEASMLQARLMPLPPTTKVYQGGRKTRRTRKPRQHRLTRKSYY